MLKKSDLPGIIKTGVILFLITGISAFILAEANKITAPIIEVNNQRNQEAAMRKVLPEADEEGGFEELADAADKENNITEVYAAKHDGEVIGYAVISEPMGYNGTVSMVVGVDCDGVVTGVDITSQSETPGLGANCAKPEFIEQFKGKTEGISVVKGSAEGNKIDAITSATITSKAVTEGVNRAVEAALAIEEKAE